MSVHHRHIPNTPQPKTPTFHSRINRHGLSNASSPSSPEHHHLTPSELLILIFALGILVALVLWLVWIMLEFCITFVKEKVDDMEFGKQLRMDRRRDEEVPRKAVNASLVLGKMGLGSLVDIGGKIFGGRQAGEEGRRGEEGRGLLGGAGEGHPRGGYGIFDGREGYGYHESIMYPSGTGQDRLKYADGTSESSGCVGPSHGHREQCVGECTLQTRRRSRDS